MGGQGSGGERQGSTGKLYSNRTDLAAKPRNTAPTPNVPQVGSDPNVSRETSPSASPSASPSLTPLSAPTQRPSEPITSGLPMGSGPGPEALNILPDESTEAQLIAIYRAFPSPATRLLLDAFYSERR